MDIDPNNLSKLDEQIKRLQDIRRIASDPEAMAIMEKLFSNGNAQNGNAQSDEESEPEGDEPIAIGAPPDPRNERGAQISAVRRAISRSQSHFNVSTIGDAVRSMGLGYSNIAVGRVLKRLEKIGEIETVQKGSGSSPNQYMPTNLFTVSGRNGQEA